MPLREFFNEFSLENIKKFNPPNKLDNYTSKNKISVAQSDEKEITLDSLDNIFGGNIRREEGSFSIDEKVYKCAITQQSHTSNNDVAYCCKSYSPVYVGRYMTKDLKHGCHNCANII